MSILSDYIKDTVDNRGRNPKYYSYEKYPVIDNVLIKNFLYPDINCASRYIDEDTFQNFLRGYVHKNMPIMTLVGNGIGNVSMAPDDNVAIVQNTIGFLVNDNLDEVFLYYYLLNNQDRIRKFDRGSGQPSVRKTDILGMEVDIPDLTTQKRIASMLYSLDNKIRINNELNQNLYEQARSLYRYWEAISTDRRCSISDIATINPETYSPKENWEYVNYLDTSSVFSGVIGEIQTIRPSEEKLPSRARRILRQGDIVYSTVRPNQLHYGIVSNPLPNMLGSTGFAVIRSKDSSIPNEIIYLALTEPTFIEQMQQIAEQSVSTFPSIKPSDLDACTIPKTIGGNIELMDSIKACFTLASKNDKENKLLALLRDILLPKLMSGELDVSEIEL